MSTVTNFTILHFTTLLAILRKRKEKTRKTNGQFYSSEDRARMYLFGGFVVHHYY